MNTNMSNNKCTNAKLIVLTTERHADILVYCKQIQKEKIEKPHSTIIFH